ncbi:MAG TPA: 2Fe-2S iron-sulfur cluster-binding protein [Burkholderiales bacterium]|nr:2Fe-2S iron-sulfur cluster-binding protein [Burkholderiales bacterium]
MSEIITLSFDGQSVTVEAGTTIHKAAQSIGIEIPTICYHEHCTSNGLCRMCVVEVEGARVLSPACVAQISEGMKVKTRSERVERSRRTIVEMLGSTVDLSEAPDIQRFAQEYHADLDRFAEGAERRHHPVIDDNPMFIRDYEKCILCWRCVQVCADDAQYAFAINFDGRGFETSIGTFFDKGMTETTCVFCGQCVGVCPTGALKPKREWLLEQGKTPDELMQLTRTERRRKGKP